MSSAPKAEKSVHESTLARIADATSRESQYIQGKIGKDFINESKRDRTREVLGQISADQAIMARQVPTNRASPFKSLATVDTLENARNVAMIEGTTQAKEHRGQSINRALRTGKGLSATAQNSMASLADIANKKAQDKVQRDMAKRGALMQAGGTLAGGLSYAYKNDLGIFADDEVVDAAANSPNKLGVPA